VRTLQIEEMRLLQESWVGESTGCARIVGKGVADVRGSEAVAALD
jgi:hypothetical protein